MNMLTDDELWENVYEMNLLPKKNNSINYPDKFIEDFLGMKLNLCQNIILKILTLIEKVQETHRSWS